MTLDMQLKNESGFSGLAAERAAENRRHAKEYLSKHQLAPAQITAAPASNLRLVVVIPCRDESELLLTLEDLDGCDDPGCAVEAVVVLNSSEMDPGRVRLQNRESLTAIESLKPVADAHRRVRFHALNFDRLPAKHAGVGLARKLGMDEAVGRLLAADARDGIVVCLDADCRVERNYLSSIAAHFDRYPRTPACSIHFEHPLSGPLSKTHYRAVTEYELYLRYYRWGLKFCAHPCAHHTVGSCMAVRASAYVRQGGMNRRKGAEDFYFLNKLMLLGHFTELRETTVMPSPRESWRVPFGTGRAVSEAIAKSAAPLGVYAPEVFDEIAALTSNVQALRDDEAMVMATLPDTLRAYLKRQDFRDKLAEIRTHTATSEAFESRFFRWFDGFRALKFVRFASEHRYPRVPVHDAAFSLFGRMNLLPGDHAQTPDATALLAHYRRMDREGRMMAFDPADAEPASRVGRARL
jgi:hypothetical protein